MIAVPEEIKHKEEENPMKYTEDEKQEKLVALKIMKDLWPTVEPYYAELIYDFCKRGTKEQHETVKEKIESEPFKYSQEHYKKVFEKQNE